MLLKRSQNRVWSGFRVWYSFHRASLFAETLPGRSSWSLHHLPWHMNAQAIIRTVLTSNIYIGLCRPKSINLTQLRSHEMFEVLLIVRINMSLRLRGMLNFRLLRDAFSYRLARGIPLKAGVPYPWQWKIMTPPPHLPWTILSLQISLSVWLPPPLLHIDHRYKLQQQHQVEAVVAHQHPEEPQHIALYPAMHPALLSLPLLWAVLKSCLPPSLIQKPAQSLQIHSQRELAQSFRDRGSGNCNRGRCLHLDQWSLAVTASIDLVTQTWHCVCLQWADSWSSTCGTDGSGWVQPTWRH